MKHLSLRQQLAMVAVAIALFISALAAGLSGGPRAIAAVNWNGPQEQTNAVNWT
jgi:hypothetical protein